MAGTGDPRGFLTIKRAEPQRRPVQERTKDWREFYVPTPDEHHRTQGARCMDCGVPFCQGDTGCPVQNVIPEWNLLVREGRWRDASLALHATNNFPELTGRLCPAPCETACVLGLIEQPVAIRNIEQDRKSTRLNSSHSQISYAVFCLKKKNKKKKNNS